MLFSIVLGKNLLDYVLSESLCLTQWLIKMSVAHQVVCMWAPCVSEPFYASGV